MNAFFSFDLFTIFGRSRNGRIKKKKIVRLFYLDVTRRDDFFYFLIRTVFEQGSSVYHDERLL
jgi:hypothetical protein